jgi:zinc protease
LSSAEIEARKASLTGTFGRTAATSAGLAALLAADAVYGVDPGESARYPAAINVVGVDQARAAATRLVDPARLQLVIVGDAKLFIQALRKVYPNVEVIPAAELDLESPSLRRPRAAQRGG